MNIISEAFRAIIWLILCLALAAGLLVFALIYAGLKFAIRRFEWKQVSYPSVRFAK